MPQKTKEQIYFVQGMHCASCEILIEKKLIELRNVKSVEASVAKGEVIIEFSGERPSAKKLSRLFEKENYVFSEKPVDAEKKYSESGWLTAIVAAGLIIFGFFLLNRLGLANFVNVNSKSSLPLFFVFGLLAGISSCAALVGGIILSMSKQWHDLYAGRTTTWQKLQPHFLFNAGRIVSYTLLGAVLGVLGSRLQISLRFTSFLIMSVSGLMFLLALQMLGVKRLRRFQITMPKFATRYIADESHFRGRYLPFLMGGLTFFLPCGFTITSQGLALLSGNPWQGGLIMLLFALGTLPMLLAIGFSSVKFSNRPHWANGFLKVAGILVLFFALFNINNQLNVLGAPSLNDLALGLVGSVQNRSNIQKTENDLPSIIDGKQTLSMEASASGYKPNYFKVRVGIPVRWEIKDTGTSGCTNAIISQGLFSDQIDLKPGQTSIKEFTPQRIGKYKFSCWMGMVSGVIEVVDKDILSPSANSNLNDSLIPSGASSCGCGRRNN